MDLTYERLISLQSKSYTKGNAYAKGGGSQRRIKNALRHPICECACKLPFKIMLKLCLAFWALVKNEQDALLWSLQNESEQKKRKQWFLQGQASESFTNNFWGLDLEIFTEFRRTSLPPTGFPKSYQQCFGASIWIYSLNLVGHQHPLYRRTSSVSSCLGSLAWCWEAPAEPLQKGVQGQRHAVVWAWRILHSM